MWLFYINKNDPKSMLQKKTNFYFSVFLFTKFTQNGVKILFENKIVCHNSYKNFCLVSKHKRKWQM